jgi:hypothetical protein
MSVLRYPADHTMEEVEPVSTEEGNPTGLMTRIWELVETLSSQQITNRKHGARKDRREIRSSHGHVTSEEILQIL